ncbi:MAG: glycine hydroxymethyltransferase [Capsulimonadaceae bacterium]
MTTDTTKSLLQTYLAEKSGGDIDTGAAAVYASLDHLLSHAPTVARAIIQEFRDQRSHLKLIASENYSSLATQLAHGNLLTDKYAEGFPGHRFYAGCENVDTIEAEAADLACRLFDAEHAYVQPHSGADANMVAYLSVLAARVETPVLAELDLTDPAKATREQWARVREAMHSQRLLGLDYYSGGHLTHGYRHNISAQLFDTYSYSVDPQTRLLDLDQVRAQAHQIKPLILLAGYSAYPRKINFAKMREIADEVGAVFMVDMAHFAGLVAGKVFTGDYEPVAHAHIVTSTTHKTLRGPRGGIVLCKHELADVVDKGCPAVLGGPLPHAIAAKAVAFREALRPEFRTYAHKIVENCETLANAAGAEGMKVVTGGTDNHLMLIDVHESFGLTGRQAESALRECGITLNRNSLPFDVNGPWYTSGLRLGTAAVTTLGMGAGEMREIAAVIKTVLAGTKPATMTKGENKGQSSKAKYDVDPVAAESARGRVADVLRPWPLYPELDLGLLSRAIEE